MDTMTLDEAKAIFKIANKYQQSDLDSVYSFEKNLLLEQISIETNPADLEYAQKNLSRLERAYSVLKLSLEHPNQIQDDDGVQDTGGFSIKSPIVIGGVSGIALAAVLFFVFNPQNGDVTSNKAEHKANQSSNQISKKPSTPIATQSPSIPVEKNSELYSIIEKTERLNTIWNGIAKAHNVNLPQPIQDLYKQAQSNQKKGYYTQAGFSYELYQKQLTEHIASLQAYLNVFNKNNDLLNRWHSIDSTLFTYAGFDKDQEGYQSIKDSLEKGSTTEYTPAGLQQMALLFEQNIEKAESVIAQRNTYFSLKSQWKKKVLNSGFYTLTPSIKNMISEAENTPYDFTNLDTLNDVTLPRLINHFKQHLNK